MLRPVDMQIILLQSSKLEKAQQAQQHHPEFHHKHLALKLHEDEYKKRLTVRDTHKADLEKVGEERRLAQRKRHRGRSDKERDRRLCGDGDVAAEVEEGRIFDITV